MENNSIVKNRYEFITAFSATMCNPNGNPDMANEPRQDPVTGFGYVTDVAVKRWIRNYVDNAYSDEKGFDILMRQGVNINRRIAESVFAVNEIESTEKLPKGKTSGKEQEGKPVNPHVRESAEHMCSRFWDCRTFGGVMSTGLNAGQIRGAVQIEMAKSVSPVRIEDLTITRMCYVGENDWKRKTIREYEEAEKQEPDDKKRTIGEKKIVYYGLYVLRGTISALFAEKTGFTEKDLRILCEAIIQMIPNNVSSSKAGMSLALPLILFKHVGTQNKNNPVQQMREAKLGCVPAQNLFRLLNITQKQDVEYPGSIDDYDISFNLSGLPGGVEVGFKNLPFEDFKWGEEIRNGDYGIKII